MRMTWRKLLLFGKVAENKIPLKKKKRFDGKSLKEVFENEREKSRQLKKKLREKFKMIPIFGRNTQPKIVSPKKEVVERKPLKEIFKERENRVKSFGQKVFRNEVEKSRQLERKFGDKSKKLEEKWKEKLKIISMFGRNARNKIILPKKEEIWGKSLTEIIKPKKENFTKPKERKLEKKAPKEKWNIIEDIVEEEKKEGGKLT